MKPNIPNYGFIIILFSLNLMLALYATPITDIGDTGDYILLSKSILGETVNKNLQQRSPLYSIIMAGFVLIFKTPLIIGLFVYCLTEFIRCIKNKKIHFHSFVTCLMCGLFWIYIRGIDTRCFGLNKKIA